MYLLHMLLRGVLVVALFLSVYIFGLLCTKPDKGDISLGYRLHRSFPIGLTKRLRGSVIFTS